MNDKEDLKNKVYIRKRGSFSDRSGIRPIDKTIQYNDFSEDTRKVLKNYILEYITLSKSHSNRPSYEYENLFANAICINLFNIEIDSEESSYDNVMKIISNIVLYSSYDQVLSLIEYLASNLYIIDQEAERKTPYLGYAQHIFYDLHKEFNKLFIEECIGYRFVNDVILKITNKQEIESIVDASKTSISKVNEHISNAINALSDKKSGNYKKVISESIMAIESLLKKYSDEKDDTLTKMLKTVFDKIEINSTLKESIQKLYWFACNEPGIRHENNKKATAVEYDEAKLVLVITSSIINYLLPILANIKNQKSH